MKCGYCGSRFHTITNCPKTFGGQGNRNSMRCSYCGSKQHNLEACPKTWGGKQDSSTKDDYVLD